MRQIIYDGRYPTNISSLTFKKWLAETLNVNPESLGQYQILGLDNNQIKGTLYPGSTVFIKGGAKEED